MLSLHHALLKSYHSGRSLHRSAEVGCGGHKDNNRSHFRFTATDPGSVRSCQSCVSQFWPLSRRPSLLFSNVRHPSHPHSRPPPRFLLQQLQEDFPSPAPRVRPLPDLPGPRLPAFKGQLPGSSGFLRPGPHPSPGPHGPPAAASFLHRPQSLSRGSSIYTHDSPSTPPASVFLPLACCLSTAEPPSLHPL